MSPKPFDATFSRAGAPAMVGTERGALKSGAGARIRIYNTVRNTIGSPANIGAHWDGSVFKLGRRKDRISFRTLIRTGPWTQLLPGSDVFQDRGRIRSARPAPSFQGARVMSTHLQAHAARGKGERQKGWTHTRFRTLSGHRVRICRICGAEKARLCRVHRDLTRQDVTGRKQY